MNIHEYQAKQLFQQYGIAIPVGKLAVNPNQAREVAQEIGGESWVVKAQVHAGGRGKAGGVKLVDDFERVGEETKAMLGTRLATIQTGPEGLPVESV